MALGWRRIEQLRRPPRFVGPGFIEPIAPWLDTTRKPCLRPRFAKNAAMFPSARPWLFLLMSLPAAAAELPPPNELPIVKELPDALTLSSGQRIATAEEWKAKRAPELERLIQHYEYGVLPPKPGKITAKIEREDPEALGGKAHLKELELSWGAPGASIHLLLVLPKSAKAAPVFLGLNFNGNHEALADPKVRLPEAWMRTGDPKGSHKAGEATRGKEEQVWNIAMAIERGYGVATFYNGDVIPDNPELAAERLKLLRPAGSENAPDACATIAAWAWCLMRAVDYLVTDPRIDPKRIAIVGHSRNGKTALLAAALDERIALAIPSQAGCGGTAPCRVAPELAAPQANGRPTVETVAQINKSFPHWFCGNFKGFNDEPTRLPFDQHALIALCAPRPVLVSAATEDLWANPAGQYELLKAADPVYRLVAGDGLGTGAPEPKKLIPSRLGYFLRPGKHAMSTEDWAAWLDYADQWLR